MKSNSRRGFLRSAAVLAPASLSGAVRQAGSPSGKTAEAAIPQVPFGKYRISRLIAGCNQFYGYSHFNPLLDQLMREWNTPERVCQTFHSFERNGINVYQYGHSERANADWTRYREEGGKMQMLAVVRRDLSLEEFARRWQPMAIYHHGELTDDLFRAGKLQAVHEYVKRIRQTGALAGVGTHIPEVVERIEHENWDVDFFLLCAYNRRRTPEEIRKLLGDLPLPAQELYLESDPARAYNVARQTAKTCFLFKILAAGRLTHTPQSVDRAFRTAYESIKPRDGVVVGMHPRFKDEVKENAERVNRILQAVR